MEGRVDQQQRNNSDRKDLRGSSAAEERGTFSECEERKNRWQRKLSTSKHENDVRSQSDEMSFRAFRSRSKNHIPFKPNVDLILHRLNLQDSANLLPPVSFPSPAEL